MIALDVSLLCGSGVHGDYRGWVEHLFGLQRRALPL
jgi:hypothetical protein